MAEALDLDDWEVLSRNSSAKDEVDEEDDEGFTYFEYLEDNDSDKRGELSDVGELGQADCGGVVGFGEEGEGSGAKLGEFSRDSSNSEMVAVTDGKGFDGYGADFNLGRDDPTEEFVASVTCDEQDSIGELGFGEMEVLNEFYSNEGDDGVANYEKTWLPRENNSSEGAQFHTANPNGGAFPFQGIYNSDSVLATEPISEVVDWKSPKSTDGFFDMRMGFQSQVSSGNCSSDREEQTIPNGSDDAEVGGGEVGDGAKGEKVVVSWLKVPIEVIKYCVFGVRPVWSISMAMGFLGFLMFSRSYYLYLYRKNQKDGKTRPALKVRFDEKKRAAIQTRAARLNKAVGLVRQDPILRPPFPAFGVTLFPAMSSFQWAP